LEKSKCRVLEIDMLQFFSLIGNVVQQQCTNHGGYFMA